jgi:hypothetical protein
MNRYRILVWGYPNALDAYVDVYGNTPEEAQARAVLEDVVGVDEIRGIYEIDEAGRDISLRNLKPPGDGASE